MPHTYLSDFLVAELTGLVSVVGKPSNESTSQCATPGEEDFSLRVHGQLPKPLTEVAAQFYEGQGFTTKLIQSGVFVKKDGETMKCVVITQVRQDSDALVSVRWV